MSYSPGSLPPADPGHYWWVDPATGEYFQLPDGADPPPGSVPSGGAPDVPSRTTEPDGTVTVGPPASMGPTPEQIAAAERGRFFEGRSFGQAELDAWIQEALGKGVPQGWIDSFLARNPNDANRLYEQWLDEQSPNGAANRSGGSGGGGGGGGMVGLDPPGPWNFRDFETAPWQQPGAFDGPDWTEPAPWQQPDPFVGPTFQEPEPWTYSEFAKPTLEEAQQEPGYQFALEQGQKAMEMSAAARGTLNTGGTLKDLIGYGQRMGEQNYNNVFNRSRDTWSSNKDLSKSIWDTGYDVIKDKYDADYTKASDEYDKGYLASKELWDRGYLSSKEGYDRDYLAAKDEYDKAYQASKDAYDKGYTAQKDAYEFDRGESLQSYQTLYNIWVQKMIAAREMAMDDE